MVKNNPLLDEDFLLSLEKKTNREVFAKIIALNAQEVAIESLEGKVTGGTINIDGSSKIRRSCSLTLSSNIVQVNDFVWGVKNKFRLELGLLNKDDDRYDNIIWFNQGIYVINSFSSSLANNNYTISISGQDKMCLLNGDLNGAILDNSVDFGTYDYYDRVTGAITNIKIPVFDIIYNGVQTYGHELARNITIKDIPECGYELLEYKGTSPLYLLKNTTKGYYENMTVNGNMSVSGEDGAQSLSSLSDAQLLSENVLFYPDEESDKPAFSIGESGDQYQVLKITTGMVPGYRTTSLTFDGDLIANAGDAFTSVLDKIVQMLGDYEYFYDIDGRFVFQKKRTYTQMKWTGLYDNSHEDYSGISGRVDDSFQDDTFKYHFDDSYTVISLNSNPDVKNIKNDIVVWGKRKSASGSEVPIHVRCAIQSKPIYYYSSWSNEIYITQDFEELGYSILPSLNATIYTVDWRELIYQMAIDNYQHNATSTNYGTEENKDALSASTEVKDFYIYIRDNSKVLFQGKQIYLYPEGVTNYEQYYTDMEGFWRQLYSPNYTECELPSSIGIGYYVRTKTPTGYQYLLIREDNQDYYGPQAMLQKTFFVKQENFTPVEKSKVTFMTCVNYYYTDEESDEKQKVNALNRSKVFNNENTLYFEKELTYIPVDDQVSVFSDIVGLEYDENHFCLVGSSYTRCGAGRQPKDVIKLYSRDTEFSFLPETITSPETLNFYIDFIDPNEYQLEQYSIQNIGQRSKVIKEDKVKSIYYREIPNLIFTDSSEKYRNQRGYVYININSSLKNLFNISTYGISATDKVKIALNNNTFISQQISLTGLPVYRLDANTRISIMDARRGIVGDYSVNKISIPLGHSGNMTINAQKIYDIVI